MGAEFARDSAQSLELTAAHEAGAGHEAIEWLRKRDELRHAIQLGIDQANRGKRINAEIVFRQLEQRLSAANDRRSR
jgi:hypothetical protein